MPEHSGEEDDRLVCRHAFSYVGRVSRPKLAPRQTARGIAKGAHHVLRITAVPNPTETTGEVGEIHGRRDHFHSGIRVGDGFSGEKRCSQVAHEQMMCDFLEDRGLRLETNVHPKASRADLDRLGLYAGSAHHRYSIAHQPGGRHPAQAP